MRFETHQVFPMKPDSSFIWTIDARNDVEEGGLSGSIGSDQPNNLSLIYGKGDIREDR
jgi:hypothetical protein